jgi:hypothetical protein
MTPNEAIFAPCEAPPDRSKPPNEANSEQTKPIELDHELAMETSALQDIPTFDSLKKIGFVW